MIAHLCMSSTSPSGDCRCSTVMVGAAAREGEPPPSRIKGFMAKGLAWEPFCCGPAECCPASVDLVLVASRSWSCYKEQPGMSA